jgi:hypothetical protein|tara:strand:+ start:957 stop:1139 length:183 start_codon:yes stop_codon:yes gene_type:complete
MLMTRQVGLRLPINWQNGAQLRLRFADGRYMMVTPPPTARPGEMFQVGFVRTAFAYTTRT